MKMRMPFVVVASLVAAGAAWAVAQPASSDPQPAHLKKVVFSKDATDQRTMLDLGEEGFSAGDRVVHQAVLYDAQDTSRQVGSYRGDGVILSTDPGSFQTIFINQFPEGSITVLGAGDFATAESGQTVSIVGGTGAYRLARGTVTAQRTKVGTEEGTKFTFEVFTR